MSLPLISVIVPVYNVEKYLEQCLDSLLEQTLRNIEIICVDDGSADNSLKIIKKYASKDKRILYVSQKNQGLSGARNKGLTLVKAPYVMFCDADDWYDKTMCEKMYHAITEHKVDFAYCGVNMFYDIPNPTTQEADREYYRIKHTGIQPITQTTWQSLDSSVCNKIMKKQMLDEYHLRFPVGLHYEDFCFFFQLLTVSKKMYVLPEYLYHYRRRADSIMVLTFNKKTTLSLDHIHILTQIYRFLHDHDLWLKWKETFYAVFQIYYERAKQYLPFYKKYLAKKSARSLLDILDLSSTEKAAYRSFIIYGFPYLKQVKIMGLKVIKFKSVKMKKALFVLGIQLYSRKLKGNKEMFSILYLPFFKRKI